MAIAYDGINYFPVGVNFMEENAMEVIEAKYGIKGSAIVLKLMCKIYKEGYYIRWDEEQCLIFANKAGREVQAEEGAGDHRDSVHQRNTGQKQLSGKRNTDFGKYTESMDGSDKAKEKRVVGAPLPDGETGKRKWKSRHSPGTTRNSATRAVQKGKNTC